MKSQINLINLDLKKITLKKVLTLIFNFVILSNGVIFFNYTEILLYHLKTLV